MNNWMVIPSDSDLSHHGILGMKWGKQNGPPYPLSEKQHNKIVKAVKKVSRIGDAIQEHKDRKADRKEQKKLKKEVKKVEQKAKSEKILKESVEEKRVKAVQHGSYKELYALKDHLSYNDLNNAMAKIRLDQELYSKAYPKKKGFMDTMDNFFNKVEKVQKWTDKGIKFWDTYADILNSSDAVRKGKVKGVKKIRGKNDDNK